MPHSGQGGQAARPHLHVRAGRWAQQSSPSPLSSITVPGVCRGRSPPPLLPDAAVAGECRWLALPHVERACPAPRLGLPRGPARLLGPPTGRAEAAASSRPPSRVTVWSFGSAPPPALAAALPPLPCAPDAASPLISKRSRLASEGSIRDNAGPRWAGARVSQELTKTGFGCWGPAANACVCWTAKLDCGQRQKDVRCADVLCCAVQTVKY